MRYLLAALVLAPPALAHPGDLPHGHSADWAMPFALVLICVAAVVAQRRAIRARARK